MTPPDLAVVDVETTGFAYTKHDRIVEIGIVRTDFDGGRLLTYELLINPERNVGPTHIHGVTAEMVRDAPPFPALADSILEVLEGTCLVAHNAPFDAGFLTAELQRAGYEIDEIPSYCTLKFTSSVFPELPSKKLERVCEFLDIDLDRAHAALSDARATEQLLSILRQEHPGLVSEREESFHWGHSVARGSADPFSRDHFASVQEEEPSRIGALLAKLPSVETNDEGANAYAALLDEVLLDRIVTEEERESISSLANEYGISARRAEQIHLTYLKNVIRYALLDDVISGTEREDITRVQRLLGLEDHDLGSLIADVRRDLDADYDNALTAVDETLKGKSVCFTGSLTATLGGEHIDRKTAQQLADERGMTVKKGVTKKLDYLVASDPHTQSGKAKKARRYDVPIVAEMEFWRRLGVAVE